MNKTAFLLLLFVSLSVYQSDAGKIKKLLKYGLGAGALLHGLGGSHHHHLGLLGLGAAGLALASHGLGSHGGGGHHATFVPYPVHHHSSSIYLHDFGHGHGGWW